MNSTIFNQNPSFSMFCILQNLSSQNAALIDVFSSVDKEYFTKIFDCVEIIGDNNLDYFQNRFGEFDLIAFQDICSVVGKTSLFVFFKQIREKLSQKGIFICGFSNLFYDLKNRSHAKKSSPPYCNFINYPLFNRTRIYVNALKKVGFSDIRIFYSIPSHKNIMHVCRKDKLSLDYYLRYMYPKPVKAYKYYIISLMQKAGMMTMLMPSRLLVAKI